MKIQLVILLFAAFWAKGISIRCYNCTHASVAGVALDDSCEGPDVNEKWRIECPTEYSACITDVIKASVLGIESVGIIRSCGIPLNLGCGDGTILGISGLVSHYSCHNGDYCNNHNGEDIVVDDDDDCEQVEVNGTTVKDCGDGSNSIHSLPIAMLATFVALLLHIFQA